MNDAEMQRCRERHLVIESGADVDRHRKEQMQKEKLSYFNGGIVEWRSTRVLNKLQFYFLRQLAMVPVFLGMVCLFTFILNSPAPQCVS